METSQGRLEINRRLRVLKKEIPQKTDWRDLSFQIGRKSVGGDYNIKNPNIDSYGSGDWINLMINQRQLRKEGVQYLRDGVMSVVNERKNKGVGELEEKGLFPLRHLADCLLNDIEPKISNRGRHGDESMKKLQALIVSLFLSDQTPGSIEKIVHLLAFNQKR